MKFAVIICRTLLALIYLYYSLDFFFHISAWFQPIHAAAPPHPALLVHARALHPQSPAHSRSMQFLTGLEEAGYFFPFMKIIELSSGFFLLINRFTTLFTVVIFPVTLNIFLYHLFLGHGGLYVGATMLFFNIMLGVAYFKYYKQLFTIKPDLIRDKH